MLTLFGIASILYFQSNFNQLDLLSIPYTVIIYDVEKMADFGPRKKG